MGTAISIHDNLYLESPFSCFKEAFFQLYVHYLRNLTSTIRSAYKCSAIVKGSLLQKLFLYAAQLVAGRNN